jgi:hypothetical protein
MEPAILGLKVQLGTQELNWSRVRRIGAQHGHSLLIGAGIDSALVLQVLAQQAGSWLVVRVAYGKDLSERAALVICLYYHVVESPARQRGQDLAPVALVTMTSGEEQGPEFAVSTVLFSKAITTCAMLTSALAVGRSITKG